MLTIQEVQKLTVTDFVDEARRRIVVLQKDIAVYQSIVDKFSAPPPHNKATRTGRTDFNEAVEKVMLANMIPLHKDEIIKQAKQFGWTGSEESASNGLIYRVPGLLRRGRGVFAMRGVAVG